MYGTIELFWERKELEKRFQNGQTIVKNEQELLAKETKKWHEILTRMFDIIQFLAKQNLALCGHREDDTSTNRGNFLELAHLLAKYDPVLREHLVRIKMDQNNSLTYMSTQIQSESIEILGDKVCQVIIVRFQKTKYYSMIFDSTTYTSHKDQTSQVVRYMVIENQEIRVEESFTDFIEIKKENCGSTLNSGIISPSEIPDSPGEAMSPFIHKNKHSEFQFPSNEKSMDPILDKLKNNSTEQFMDEAFEDLSEDDIKVFNDEGDCFSVSNLSALSIQADSTHLSISFIQRKSEFLEIFDKPSVNVNCGVTSLNTSFVEKCNNEQLNTSDEINEQDYNFSEIINVSTTKCSQNENLKDHDSYNLANDGITCERKGISDKGINSYQNTSSAADDTAFKEISVDVYLQESESADYSKDISDDDECDPLIEECILSGMPKKPSSNHDLSKELSNNYQSNGVSVSKEITTQPHCSYSDNDASDDENIEIIDECIQLGMPQKSSSPHMQDKIVSGPALEESLNKKYLNVSPRMSSTSNPMDKFRNCDFVSSQGVDPKELNKSDEESDIDESELLVQQCIQLGMPKSKLRNSRNMKATRKAYAFTKELVCACHRKRVKQIWDHFISY
ncbi:hypothetical protein TNCT_222281 [Trichonephila clavata]|uniref:DUF4371 domain-containing protein n=1 Tax=Trichonephila clavata TaxID=2740835 RepID=A0A8X6LGV5_TRICU|nr:hypothetical protein TNCT_222281 [Trichonephila clavata]